MKSVQLNFDLNDYQTKSDFLATLRNLVKTFNNQSKDPNKLKLEQGKKIYSLTFYLADDIDDSSTERAIYLVIPSDDTSLKLLVKHMSKGYEVLQSETFLTLLQKTDNNRIRFETEDGCLIQVEYRED